MSYVMLLKHLVINKNLGINPVAEKGEAQTI